MLAGKDFYLTALSLEKKYSKKGQLVENLIQTNATLINKPWAVFLKKHNFRVGISLDGNCESQNMFRKTAGGRGSFKSTIAGFRQMKSLGITPGIIQTITRETVKKFSSNFSFFTKYLGVKGWSINVFDFLSANNPEMLNQGLTNRDLKRLYTECINLWLKKNDKNLCIREIENFGAGVIGKLSQNCSFNGSCGRYFCLNYNGDIYPCDRFSGDPDAVWGNITESSLRDILFGEKAKIFRQKSHKLPKDCIKCTWKNHCNNGCTAMRDKVSDKYIYCEARKATFSYLRNVIK